MACWAASSAWMSFKIPRKNSRAAALEFLYFFVLEKWEFLAAGLVQFHLLGGLAQVLLEQVTAQTDDVAGNPEGQPAQTQ